VKGNLCERIVKLDPQIRFVGIVNSKGKVVEGGYQEGVEPLLDGQDEQIMYMQSLSNMALLHDPSDKLGNVKYSHSLQSNRTSKSCISDFSPEQRYPLLIDKLRCRR
jgi:hypothetical protein